MKSSSLPRLAPTVAQSGRRRSLSRPLGACEAAIAGWGFRLGAAPVEAVQVDREFGLAEGTLEQRTGIASLARVDERDNEVSMARQACQSAMNGDLDRVDLLLATSETNVGHPALAATLHADLGLSSHCAAMDIGGACAGLVHAFSVAQAMLCSRARKAALVVASEVHSRWFTPQKVTWKLGALFGDGACAFLLCPTDKAPPASFRIGKFVFGCETSLSSTIRVGLSQKDPQNDALDVDFRGTLLADVAVNRLSAIVKELEQVIHTARARFSGFAIHQPNPRLVEILARHLRLPPEKIPAVARTAGNLGSATCGVSLCRILDALRGVDDPGPVLMASLGPGLLWAGTCLHPAQS